MGTVEIKSVLLMLGMVLSLISVAHAAQGIAVFYARPYTPSACNQYKDDGVMIAGVSDALWNGGAACGRNYKVTCIRGVNKAPHPCKQGRTVTVKVVDYCRKGCGGVINLSKDAFSQIADPDAGKVFVQYDRA